MDNEIGHGQWDWDNEIDSVDELWVENVNENDSANELWVENKNENDNADELWVENEIGFGWISLGWWRSRWRRRCWGAILVVVWSSGRRQHALGSGGLQSAVGFRSQVQALSLSLSLSLSLGSGRLKMGVISLKVKQKRNWFYTKRLDILRSMEIIFRLTKFSGCSQTHSMV